MKVSLGSICSFVNGGTPSKDQAAYWDGNIPWITSADITGPIVVNARCYTTLSGITNSATNLVKTGTVLLVTRTGVGKAALAGVDLCFSQDITALIPDPKRLDAIYLIHFLATCNRIFAQFARGATIKGITRDVVDSLEIPLPPLPEQCRLAAILDQADALRAKRRAALAKLDTLAQSLFIEMFGDPAMNPKGWRCMAVGDLASKFSDGPFGSNLKSEHYTESGVRVIRLQNIGVGELLDDDLAYISEDHFASLRKHECLPGDLLIGTLGDPNLRACIQPNTLPIALNKADCVQLRPNPKIAEAAYLCALINHPSTGNMAQSLILGQTRGRISMGRLRGLKVPVPAKNLQSSFSTRIEALGKLKNHHRTSLAHLNALFASLQHRAFRGEL